MSDRQLSVVIPAFNEEENLPKTLTELVAALDHAGIDFELVVVNDNSVDGTRDLIAGMMAEDSRIRTVNRSAPSGFGRAVRAGLEAVAGDVVVICMADSSDDPKDVVAYYRKICEGYDCVFGSRFIKGSQVVNYPRGKLVANRIVNKCIQWLYRCKFNDLTNAFKAYRTEVVRACSPLQACHFNITIEMALGALNRHYNIAQIPINWYGRTWGSSNLKLSEMGRRYLNTLLKAYSERVLISDDIMAERLARRSEDAAEVNPHRLVDRLASLESRVGELEKKSSTEP